MALEHISFMSVEEYLELEERNPDTRYEYFDGYVYMMSGGTANHAIIAGNIHAILRNLLRGSFCRAYNSDMKVRVSANRYFLPDVTVSCDTRDRGTATTVQSPRLVIEVLSPGTEARDRGIKLQAYTVCPSIEEYVLVNYRTMRIEKYHREQKKWVYDAYEAGDEVELASLNVHFPIAEAYEDVIFGNGEPDKLN